MILEINRLLGQRRYSTPWHYRYRATMYWQDRCLQLIG